MDCKKEMVKINSMSGRYSSYEIFTDWIKCASLAISNATELWATKICQDREKAYMDTIKKYTREEARHFPELNKLLTDALEEEMTDVLGWVYMAEWETK